jgi:predicted negative regulator of RcsB-dependent stress response
MNRDQTYLVVGVLAIAVIVLGYLYYQERQKSSGIEISVGHSSISIDKK